jgi:hypothetical protein
MAESQAAANPLIKTDAEDDRSALEGAGLFQDFWDAGTAVADGNWTEGLVNAAFGAGGIAELVADPSAHWPPPPSAGRWSSSRGCVSRSTG